MHSRASADRDSIVGKLARGQTVEIIASEGDWISSTDILSFTATQASPFHIDLKYVGPGSAFGGSPTIAILATFASAPSINASDLANAFVFSGEVDLNSASLSINGNNLVLNFTPVPEPTTAIGFAVAFTVMGAGIRRRLNRI